MDNSGSPRSPSRSASPFTLTSVPGAVQEVEVFSVTKEHSVVLQNLSDIEPDSVSRNARKEVSSGPFLSDSLHIQPLAVQGRQDAIIIVSDADDAATNGIQLSRDKFHLSPANSKKEPHLFTPSTSPSPDTPRLDKVGSRFGSARMSMQWLLGPSASNRVTPLNLNDPNRDLHACYMSHETNMSLKELDNYLSAHPMVHGHHSGSLGLTKGFHLGDNAYRTLVVLVTAALIISLSIVLYGVIPLGSPNRGGISSKLIWLLVTNPITYTLLNLLVVMIFFSVLDERTPWHHWSRYVSIVVATYVAEVAVMFCIYPFTLTFPFMGLVSLAVAFLVTVVILRKSKGATWSTGFWCDCGYYTKQLRCYISVVVSLFLYILVLSFWLLAYRQSPAVAQALLPFVLLVLVFGWKKYLLAKTDTFPVVIAMLIAGFWIENLDDMFQTMIFPSVENEISGYITLWIRKFGENLAYLLFLTNRWFVFRVWIKDFFKHLVKTSKPHIKPIHEDVDDVDRGHSNIKPAYWRRQVQFLMYKILSQILSYVIYLTVTPQLRDEKVNGVYFPFRKESSFAQNLDDTTYRNSLIFAAFSLVTTVMTGIASYWLIKWYRHDTYMQITGSYGELFRRPQYFGFMSLILLSNTVIAFNTLQYHNRIWFFREDEPL